MLCYETASHLNLLFCLALSDIVPAAEGGGIPNYYFQLEIEIQTPHSASYTGRRIPHYCWFGVWSPDTHMAPTYMQRCMPHYQWVIVALLPQVSFDIILKWLRGVVPPYCEVRVVIEFPQLFYSAFSDATRKRCWDVSLLLDKSGSLKFPISPLLAWVEDCPEFLSYGAWLT